MKKLTSYIQPFKMYYAVFFILAVILSGLIIYQAITIGSLINKVLYKMPIDRTFLWIILTVLISRSVITGCINVFGAKLSQSVKQKLRQDYVIKKRDAAEAVTISTEAIEGTDSFYSSYIPQLFKSSIIPLSIFIFMIIFHHNTALIMLITSPFIPLFYIVIGMRTRDKAAEQMTVLSKFSNYFLNALDGIMTLKMFGQDQNVSKQVEEQSETFRTRTMIILKTAFLSTLSIEFIAMLSIGIIALEVGLGLIVFQSTSFYTAIVVLMLAPEYYNALKDLGMAFHTGKQAEGYADMLGDDEVEHIRTVYSESDENINLLATVTYPNFTLQLNNVLPLKSSVIFGPSGAGKSTLAKILTTDEFVGTGVITYPRDVKKRLYMAQQPNIIHTSIMNNITMFQNINKETVIEASRRVHMDEKIMTLPNGYDTVISKEQPLLSGGELHRLMLMRALVSEADLIIFDEPTAMLDIETEHLIQQIIQSLSNERIVYTIAHQKRTIQRANLLIYMVEGKIEQLGSHEEMAHIPLYKAVISHE